MADIARALEDPTGIPADKKSAQVYKKKKFLSLAAGMKVSPDAPMKMADVADKWFIQQLRQKFLCKVQRKTTVTVVEDKSEPVTPPTSGGSSEADRLYAYLSQTTPITREVSCRIFGWNEHAYARSVKHRKNIEAQRDETLSDPRATPLPRPSTWDRDECTQGFFAKNAWRPTHLDLLRNAVWSNEVFDAEDYDATFAPEPEWYQKLTDEERFQKEVQSLEANYKSRGHKFTDHIPMLTDRVEVVEDVEAQLATQFQILESETTTGVATESKVGIEDNKKSDFEGPINPFGQAEYEASQEWRPPAKLPEESSEQGHLEISDFYPSAEGVNWLTDREAEKYSEEDATKLTQYGTVEEGAIIDEGSPIETGRYHDALYRMAYRGENDGDPRRFSGVLVPPVYEDSYGHFKHQEWLLSEAYERVCPEYVRHMAHHYSFKPEQYTMNRVFFEFGGKLDFQNVLRQRDGYDKHIGTNTVDAWTDKPRYMSWLETRCKSIPLRPHELSKVERLKLYHKQRQHLVGVATGGKRALIQLNDLMKYREYLSLPEANFSRTDFPPSTGLYYGEMKLPIIHPSAAYDEPCNPDVTIYDESEFQSFIDKCGGASSSPVEDVTSVEESDFNDQDRALLSKLIGEGMRDKRIVDLIRQEMRTNQDVLAMEVVLMGEELVERITEKVWANLEQRIDDKLNGNNRMGNDRIVLIDDAPRSEGGIVLPDPDIGAINPAGVKASDRLVVA